jgi:solute carrier family 35 protein F1/2
MDSSRQLRVLAEGQILSLLLAGTGIFSQGLADKKVDTPSFQSFLNYVVLSFLLLRRCCRRRNNLKLEWWKYLLLAVLDVEGNYLLVRAYSEGVSITSATLLDCFTIPNVMILSRICFRTKFLANHVFGVVLCVMGLSVLVAIDATSKSSGSSSLTGDILVIVATFFYAGSNVCQEYIVKSFDIEEYLGMLGLFGAIISGCQSLALEHEQLHKLFAGTIDESPGEMGKIVALYAGFTICLASFYLLSATFMRKADATLFNLSLLSSDVFGLLAGMFLFGQHLSPYYSFAFVLTIGGAVVYNMREAVSTMQSPGMPGAIENCDANGKTSKPHSRLDFERARVDVDGGGGGTDRLLKGARSSSTSSDEAADD